MDIDTSTRVASRRNLVVCSLSFIIYNLSDASLMGCGEATSLNMLSANIVIRSPEVLIYFAWGMLFWFLIRFWQFSDFLLDWSDYCASMFKSKLMSNWRGPDSQKYFILDGCIAQPLFGRWRWNYNPGGYTIEANEYIKKLKLFLYVAIFTEKFVQYYIPYLLCFFAIIIAVGKHL